MKNTVNKRTKILRIAAGTVGVLILAVLISITHSYTGDPISKMMAKKKAIDHVEYFFRFYEYDLDITDTRYNRGVKAYEFTFQDKEQIDVRFTVISDPIFGHIKDDHSEMVDERATTVERLEKELADDAKNTVKKVADKWELKIKDGFSTSLNSYFYGSVIKEGHKIPPLNAPYSRGLGFEAWYIADFESKRELSSQEMADIITDFYNTLTDDGFLVEEMKIDFHVPDDEISVSLSPFGLNDSLSENIEKGLNGDHKGYVAAFSKKYEDERRKAEEEALKKLKY